jgi:hypothetical protein
MKASGAVGGCMCVYICMCVFLTLALVGGEWSVSCPCHFPLVHSGMRLGEWQGPVLCHLLLFSVSRATGISPSHAHIDSEELQIQRIRSETNSTWNLLWSHTFSGSKLFIFTNSTCYVHMHRDSCCGHTWFQDNVANIAMLERGTNSRV